MRKKVQGTKLKINKWTISNQKTFSQKETINKIKKELEEIFANHACLEVNIQNTYGLNSKKHKKSNLKK